MKLHTVFVTYNRLELTKRAIESYLETVTVPYTFIVVDNASSDGTQQWLMDNFPFHWDGKNEDGTQRSYVWCSPENLYPGRACNEGWFMLEEVGITGADFLQRCDNDNEFLPGWCEHVQECFEGRPELGQLGLRTAERDNFNTNNVAGDCIIRRELWDKGLRCDERPWSEFPPGYTDDSYLSQAVKEMGYEWDRVTQECIRSIATDDPDDEYYIESWRSRGILEWAMKRHGR